jgi:hypothetical protein
MGYTYKLIRKSNLETVKIDLIYKLKKKMNIYTL